MPRKSDQVTVTFDPREARKVSEGYAVYATHQISSLLLANQKIKLNAAAEALIARHVGHALEIQLASILEHKTPARAGGPGFPQVGHATRADSWGTQGPTRRS
jgi:hypothetical protein